MSNFNIRDRLVRFGELVPCKTAFIDAHTPGSNLKENTDFFVCYSPERINPGDKKHTLKNINLSIKKFIKHILISE